MSGENHARDSAADPQQMLAAFVDDASALAETDDPLDAELAGALVVALVEPAGEEATSALARDLVPAVEARGTRAALNLLQAISAVGDGSFAASARAAAERLVAAGVAAPAWAGDLVEPLTAGPFTRMHDAEYTMSVLIGVFERAGRGHALAVVVDHENCGAAEQIYLLGEDELPTLVAGIHQTARGDGVTIKTKKLGAPEFRWRVEQALEVRADHDAEDPEDLELAEEDGPGYVVLAALTRSRLATLPPARQPRGAVASSHTDEPLLLDLPAQRRPQSAKLPAKRKKSDGPAPAYQIKVSLRGANPPIWRRLLVPGDITLNRLHLAIQAAFGWDDSHLHVFDTTYGVFGQADRELGHRSDGPVTLEQVAPAPKDKIQYTYDFGDNWEHEILVEKTTPADPTVAYPLCTGGRRAAPPDDCGGVWGY
ncbi:plasmid pRiA4b ORF-3 family protein [Actinoplanes sp. NPDC049596]|uniref:plasmid pRiA4b ORF-3 family protein n=1 Tax=unclassified Actinoplanes TaxID=2626549 RepID=UPI003412196C